MSMFFFSFVTPRIQTCLALPGQFQRGVPGIPVCCGSDIPKLQLCSWARLTVFLKRDFYFSKVFLTHAGASKSCFAAGSRLLFRCHFLSQLLAAILLNRAPAWQVAFRKLRECGILFSSPSLSETVLKIWLLHYGSKLPPW